MMPSGLAKMSKQSKIICVIPAYNEQSRVSSVVNACQKYCRTILVVDDGSKDDTAIAAGNAGATVLRHPVNMGAGFATITGCRYAFEKLGADAVVTIDADGQHPPKLVPELLRKIGEGYDLVFTTRMAKNGQMPLEKRAGNWFLTAATNIACGGNFSDTQSGFKAFTRKAFQKLEIEGTGYEFCSEMAAEVARNRLKYCEVEIPAEYDAWTRVKGTDIVAGIRIFEKLLWWRAFRWK